MDSWSRVNDLLLAVSKQKVATSIRLTCHSFKVLLRAVLFAP